MSVATFDQHNHALTPGWATYHLKPLRCWRLMCWLGRHALPSAEPVQANGYSPSCYSRCRRCRRSLKWFVVGQHRYGGFDRVRAADPAGGATTQVDTQEPEGEAS